MGALKGEVINVYTFTGMDLKKKFGYRAKNDFPVVCLNQNELNITEKNIEQFSKEHFTVGARWLDDVIDNI